MPPTNRNNTHVQINCSYYESSVEKGAMKVWWPGFNIRLVLLSQATGSVSSATCQPLTSLAAKCAKLQPTVLLPLETRKVGCDNTIILDPKLCHKALLCLTQLMIEVERVSLISTNII